MKKSKLFKTICFSSLAMLMATTGVFAFAPLGVGTQGSTLANASEIETTTSGLGLDPKNDPVIYTTENGLEIKFGGATTALGGGNEKNDFAAETLPSGKPLSGYPYFTMGTYNGYAVNWVIIGKSTTGIPTTSTSTGMSDYNYEKLSTWQGKTSESPTYKHFFEQTYEATTPAGAAIKNSGTLNNYAARKIEYMFNPSIFSSIVPNSEIDAGCVLAISECCLGQAQFNSSASSATSNTNWTGSRYRYEADQDNSDATYNYTYNKKLPGDLYTYISNLYSTNLNFSSSEKQLIQAQKLTTRYYTTSSKIDTYDTDGNTLYSLFPLAATISGVSQNFCLETYLSTAGLKKAYLINNTSTTCQWWLRTGGASNIAHRVFIINPDGNIHTGAATGNLFGVRPACVIKLA